MKKTILFVLATIYVSGLLFAQPVVNSSNLPTSFSANFMVGNTTSFNPGNAGAFQTWDFSSLASNLVGVNNVVPVAGSTYQSTFPTANYCYAITIGGSTTYFYYHNLTSTKFEQYSEAYSTANPAAKNYTPNPKTIIQFPATYNSIFTDSYQDITASSPTSYTVTYDGYGTLITPFGIYTNVLRQKIIEGNVTNYKWYNSNPFYPILQTNIDNGSFALLQNTTTTGIKESLIENEITISPNPIASQAIVSFKAEQKNTTLRVVDALGKEVKSAIINGKYFVFEKENLPKGIYFLQLVDASKTLVIKKIIVE